MRRTPFGDMTRNRQPFEVILVISTRTSAAVGSFVLPATLVVAGLGAPRPAHSAAADPVVSNTPRPNIVFVLGDDVGWSDLSGRRTNLGNRSDFNETRNINRMAKQGVAFTNAYACVNCAPSRAALMTGLYAPRPTNNIYLVGHLNRGGDDTRLVGPPQGLPDGDAALPAQAVTVAETLRSGGYATGYAGKFHVTRSGSDVTALHGFDENIGGTGAAAPKRYHAANGTFAGGIGPELDAFASDYTQAYVDRNIKPYTHGVPDTSVDALVGTDKHVTDAVTDATIDFIDRHDDRPFLTFMSEYAVHSPINNDQARRDLLAKYRAKPPGATPSKPSYAALLEGLDQSVARVVDHLETTPDPRNPGHPLADNTVVVFTSDNGGRTTLGAFNGPLKGQKGELDEGGVRVPFIAWSGNRALVDRGRINQSPINGTDVYPTLAALGRTSLPAGIPFDGTSLKPALAHNATVKRPRYQHLPGYLIGGGRDQRPQSTIRAGRWKLLYSYETRTWRLYDVSRDIGERRNLASRRPGVVTRLGTKLLRWLANMNAPLATLRDDEVPMTFTVTGDTYADGQVTRHRGDELVIEPGAEVPMVLETTTG
ncbi:sulfatase [Solicola gregarius]|uniref:Sulfatase n=1 Tax=Solicola gregarius TaxID=2908642 RepID=A0AA46YLH3_9ACTN|nr:sulfatase [Solicola gregarius]UYM04873.1 sulfatase [Solicola gregarius]